MLAQTMGNLVYNRTSWALTEIINIVINKSLHNIVEYKYKCLYPREKSELP